MPNTNFDFQDSAKKLLDYAKENNGKSKTYVGVAISLVVTLLGLGFLYFEAWKHGKELAKLSHEHDVAAQKVEMAKADAIIAKDEADKNRALVEVDNHQEAALVISRKIERTELDHAQITNQINQLNSWDAVDAFLNHK